MIYLTKLVEDINVNKMPASNSPTTQPNNSGTNKTPYKGIPQGKYPVTQNQNEEPQEPQPSRLSVEEKKKLLELTSKMNEFGKAVYREGNLLEVAQALQEISQLAERYTISECGDMLEANTVKRNMGEMKKYCETFVKLSSEIHQKQQQMEALYEDYSRIVDRYFEVKDINTDDVEVKK